MNPVRGGSGGRTRLWAYESVRWTKSVTWWLQFQVFFNFMCPSEGRGFNVLHAWVTHCCSGLRVGKGSPILQRITRILNSIDGEHRGAGQLLSLPILLGK